MGCDHAYVDIRLLQENKVARALAMDVADGPLATAKANLELTELYDTGRCELRKSNGLAAYEPGEANVLICAGMGGILMQELLEAEVQKVLSFEKMILSPQSEIHLVREWLFRNGCRITQERFLQEDGKYYTVMVATNHSEDFVSGNPLQRRPDWDAMARQIAELSEEDLQKAMVDRTHLLGILQDAAFRSYAERTWGPCILEEYFAKEKSASAECFGRYVTESLRAKIRLTETLSAQPAGENTLQRLRELCGEVGILQVLLACGMLAHSR